MKRSVQVFCILLLAVCVVADGKPQAFASWLIRPGSADGPAIETTASHSMTNKATWRLLASDGKVQAEMLQPAIPSGYELNLGNCKVDGKLRYDLLAIVKHSKILEWSKDISALWFVDENLHAFVLVTGRDVECLNEGYGV